MTSDLSVSYSRIALFIDIENLIGAASTIGLPIDIAPVLDKLKEFGKVQVRRSFGDLDKCLRSVGKEREIYAVRRMLHHNLVQIEDIPYLTQSKNTADITLAVEALALAFQYADISHFAILASDRDYVPLFNKLHELGKTVIAVGIDQPNMHFMVHDASDILVYYESLFKPADLKPGQDNGDDQKELLDSYLLVLRQCVQTLEKQGAKPVASAVALLMRQNRSDFSPDLVGCASFKEFLLRAVEHKAVKIDQGDGQSDILVYLDASASIAFQRSITLPQPPMKRDYSSITDYYRKIIESKMRVALPPYKGRLRIFQSLSATYSEIIKSGSFPLREWSDETSRKLRQENASPTICEAVYKILLSLYFARCFHCEVSASDPHNPMIQGLAHGEGMWEQRFHVLCAKNIQQVIRPQQIVPEALSNLLFGPENRDLEKAEYLIQEAANN